MRYYLREKPGTGNSVAFVFYMSGILKSFKLSAGNDSC